MPDSKNPDHTPKDHGRIVPAPPERPPQPYIPPELRKIVSFGLGYAEEGEKFGWWRVKIGKSIYVRGNLCQPGDVVEVPGTDALQIAALSLAGEILDPRKGKLEELTKKLEDLNAPLRSRERAKINEPPFHVGKR